MIEQGPKINSIYVTKAANSVLINKDYNLLQSLINAQDISDKIIGLFTIVYGRSFAFTEFKTDVFCKDFS